MIDKSIKFIKVTKSQFKDYINRELKEDVYLVSDILIQGNKIFFVMDDSKDNIDIINKICYNNDRKIEKEKNPFLEEDWELDLDFALPI